MRKDFSEVVKLIEQGSFSAAEELVGCILAVEPENAEALFLLGRCFLREQRLEEARMVLEEVIARSPDLAKAHVAIAEVFRLQHLTRLAELHLIIALSMDSENRYVIRKLSALYRQMGRVSEAESWASLARQGGFDASDELERAIDYVARGQFIRADLILANLADSSLPSQMLGDLAPQEIRDRRSELAKLFLQREGISLSTVRAMLKVLESSLALSNDEISEATKEAELLILLGAGAGTGADRAGSAATAEVAEHAAAGNSAAMYNDAQRPGRYFLNSIGEDLGATELYCLYYAGTHLGQKREYQGPDLSKAFALALRFLDSVDDAELEF